tara:strand:+ start:349 stop:666 length:318 start_codon:yes stop_codon:yes gene_type:complete
MKDIEAKKLRDKIAKKFKLFVLISIMCSSFIGISQTQCKGITKDSVQCKNIVKKENSLCHNHDPNHVSEDKNKGETVICSGTTKKNQPCKNRTKDKSGKCHNHRD